MEVWPVTLVPSYLTPDTRERLLSYFLESFLHAGQYTSRGTQSLLGLYS